ncbi:hypothetical protein [Shewanella acanthi]|uniref:hypothetical protein n=1 Tax=Shewanella acanthi TaxID=2864212 RepID=UPI001C65D0F4|nr:hypothetical protein [Shewanella acanthi]QYJ80491.1 hypothetical protein K0H61_09070 [Shewanella acanthi]
MTEKANAEKTASVTQCWVYHGRAPSSGRRLLLLDKSELIFALPLVYRLIHPVNTTSRIDWFNQDEKSKTDYSLLIEQLNLLVKQRKLNTNIDSILHKVNQLLNGYFSDLGWRILRKELSQIKKRQKKSHIELSKDIILKLKHYMEAELLDSFDQAIDTLLSEHASQRNG